MAETVVVKVVAAEGASIPFSATAFAAGADLCAYLPNGPVQIEHCGYELIPTGLIVEIPLGYEGQVRPRSGLAARHGITVLNAPGTIDSDYRGEVKVLLINHGKAPFTIHNGDRIAQLVIVPVEHCTYVKVCTVSQTDRGSGGFGSTGV